MRNEPLDDGSMQLSVRIVVQMDEKLRQRADVEKTILCNLPDRMMEMDIRTRDGRKVLRYFSELSIYFRKLICNESRLLAN